MRRTGWLLGAGCGVLVGLGAAVGGVTAFGEEANAQSGFTVSAEQLKVNQNISSAAVLRSNRGLNYLRPIRTAASDAADTGTGGVQPGTGTGWTTSQIANSAVTSAKLSSGVQNNLPLYATVETAIPPVLVGNRGVSGPVSRTGVGNYIVPFGKSVQGCSAAGALMDAQPPGLPTADIVKTAINPATPTQVVVQTFSAAAGTPSVDSDFTLQVVC